jgi:hypothetical protein
MTIDDILAELPKLNPREFEAVTERMGELAREAIGKAIEEPESERPSDPERDAWLAHIESLPDGPDGLPDDLAHNHDHYLHGTPRR